MKKFLSILLVLALALSLSACNRTGNSPKNDDSTAQPTVLSTPAEDTPLNAAYLLGITNGNTKVNTNIKELAMLPAMETSTYSFILADGTPSAFADGTIPSFEGKGYSSVMMERVHASMAADLSDQIASAEPDSPEVDLAASISTAVRSIRAGEDGQRQNYLVLYHNGISTAGLIDFTDVPISELDIPATVKNIAASLPDMEGIHILWYCCGDVFDQQSKLSDNEIGLLQTFYSQLFEALNADSVDFMPDLPLDEGYCFDQPVSTIKTETVGPGMCAKLINATDADSAEAVTDIFKGGDVLDFGEDTIAFLPDSTELADPEAAGEALSHVIQHMNSVLDFRLLVAGTTTSVGSRAFSQKRAEAIAEVLVKAGIDPNRIMVLGCGCDSLFYIPDKNPDGTLNQNAPKNRSVKLMDYDSDIAAAVLASLTEPDKL